MSLQMCVHESNERLYSHRVMAPFQMQDLRLAVELGAHTSQELPIATAANEVFKKAIGAGLGDKDFSAVYQVVRNGNVADK